MLNPALSLPTVQLKLLVAICACWRVAGRTPSRKEFTQAGLYPSTMYLNALRRKGLIRGGVERLHPTAEGYSLVVALAPERSAA